MAAGREGGPAATCPSVPVDPPQSREAPVAQWARAVSALSRVMAQSSSGPAATSAYFLPSAAVKAYSTPCLRVPSFSLS